MNADLTGEQNKCENRPNLVAQQPSSDDGIQEENNLAADERG
jgi:hypothetical protein